MAGGTVVGVALVAAVFGPLLAPHEVGAVVDPDIYGPVSGAFPFGTDFLGRDVLSRIIHGARYTVGVALASERKLVISGEQVFDIRDFDIASPTVLMLRIYPDVLVQLQVEAIAAPRSEAVAGNDTTADAGLAGDGS